MVREASPGRRPNGDDREGSRNQTQVLPDGLDSGCLVLQGTELEGGPETGTNFSLSDRKARWEKTSRVMVRTLNFIWKAKKSH